MSDYYFSKSLGQGTELCLAPLSERLLQLADDTPSYSSGYFLFERETCSSSAPIRLLAHAVSVDAAWQLRDLFELE